MDTVGNFLIIFMGGGGREGFIGMTPSDILEEKYFIIQLHMHAPACQEKMLHICRTVSHVYSIKHSN